MEIVTEHGTSKTCTKCGEWNTHLGSSKVFTCPTCAFSGDRDACAARNILLRNFDTSPLQLINNQAAASAFWCLGPLWCQFRLAAEVQVPESGWLTVSPQPGIMAPPLRRRGCNANKSRRYDPQHRTTDEFRTKSLIPDQVPFFPSTSPYSLATHIFLKTPTCS